MSLQTPQGTLMATCGPCIQSTDKKWRHQVENCLPKQNKIWRGPLLTNVWRSNTRTSKAEVFASNNMKMDCPESFLEWIRKLKGVYLRILTKIQYVTWYDVGCWFICLCITRDFPNMWNSKKLSMPTDRNLPWWVVLALRSAETEQSSQWVSSSRLMIVKLFWIGPKGQKKAYNTIQYICILLCLYVCVCVCMYLCV